MNANAKKVELWRGVALSAVSACMSEVEAITLTDDQLYNTLQQIDALFAKPLNAKGFHPTIPYSILATIRFRKDYLTTRFPIIKYEVADKEVARCPECGCMPLSSHHHSKNCSYQWLPRLNDNVPAAGIKFDSGKPRMDLLDAYAMEQLVAVLTFGAKKYSANNWRGGISSSRLLAASLRHIFAYLGGQYTDPETGLSHLAHAMCCMMFAINLHIQKPECDDHNQASMNETKEKQS